MKKYKLLKDLPFAKAGDILSLERSQEYGYFKLCKDRSNPRSIELYEGIVEGFIDNFDEWFEEIKEAEKPKKYFYIGSMGHIESDEPRGWELSLSLRKMIGNHFETKEETEAYLTYLKAKAIIKQDTKGFKPDWNDEEEDKFFGYWDFKQEKVDYSLVFYIKRADIYFKTLKDIKESLEKHPIEWKTYLAYEQ